MDTVTDAGSYTVAVAVPTVTPSEPVAVIVKSCETPLIAAGGVKLDEAMLSPAVVVGLMVPPVVVQVTVFGERLE